MLGRFTTLKNISIYELFLKRNKLAIQTKIIKIILWRFPLRFRGLVRATENCRVVAGTERTNSVYTQFIYENSRKIKHLWKHQYYNTRTFNNDFAVIEVTYLIKI